MKKGLTEIVFILDRSGSMSGLEADTIGGFNSMIRRQKEIEGEAYVSVVLFGDRSEVLCDRVDIRRVEPMNENLYYARGCTALLDALGDAIRHIRNVHKYARDEDRPEKTLFFITTDGMENASRRYTYEQVRRLVERQKEEWHWEFIFLGANIDAIKVAGRFGIRPSRAVNYENDSDGVRLNYKVMSDIVTSARKAAPEEFEASLDREEALSGIREDYRERHLRSRREPED